MSGWEGVAAVTGAAGGIGRELAVQLADAGATGLALCDVDVAGLEETARLVRARRGERLISSVGRRRGVCAVGKGDGGRLGQVQRIHPMPCPHPADAGRPANSAMPKILVSQVDVSDRASVECVVRRAPSPPPPRPPHP